LFFAPKWFIFIMKVDCTMKLQIAPCFALQVDAGVAQA
jgi:hypothetical protein